MQLAHAMKAVLTAGLMCWGVAIAWSDWRYRRIPNRLLAPAAAVAMCWMVAAGHTVTGVPWTSGLLAGLFGLGVTVPAYALGKLGAGDAKFLAVLGLLTGWPVTSFTFVVAGLLGAGAGVIWWVMRDIPPVMVWIARLSSSLGGHKPDSHPDTSLQQLRLPYGTLLAIGLCAALLQG